MIGLRYRSVVEFWRWEVYKWFSSGGLRVVVGGRSRWYLMIIFFEDKVDRCWFGDDIVRVLD